MLIVNFHYQPQNAVSSSEKKRYFDTDCSGEGLLSSFKIDSRLPTKAQVASQRSRVGSLGCFSISMSDLCWSICLKRVHGGEVSKKAYDFWKNYLLVIVKNKLLKKKFQLIHEIPLL